MNKPVLLFPTGELGPDIQRQNFRGDIFLAFYIDK